MRNEELIEELINSVKMNYSENKTIRSIKKSVIQDVGLEPTSVLRRDHDGCSELNWLIEKMIGEILKDGEVKT